MVIIIYQERRRREQEKVVKFRGKSRSSMHQESRIIARSENLVLGRQVNTSRPTLQLFQ